MLVTVEDVAHVEDVNVEVVGEGDMLEGWSRGLRDPQREGEITECSVVGGKRAVLPWFSGSGRNWKTLSHGKGRGCEGWQVRFVDIARQ